MCRVFPESIEYRAFKDVLLYALMLHLHSGKTAWRKNGLQHLLSKSSPSFPTGAPASF
ncbi:hypothetical protein SB48_HM08orf06486 [Heyndrickxia coagulans]|uniref:Uncharacterized protein n=1 Tax=Heyndrickxia coagulans TaxID=1398 RepID=A0AAN0T9V9_HEYCO|nr:hypothetical protein SB48_HM08orf06486 [Heyndrickxia coagulans]